MKIGAITNGIENIGKKVINTDGKKFINKVSNFCDPNGKQVSSGVFTTLMLTCVLLPRLFTARDKTERREIFTRDTITIATMLYAMNGINNSIGKQMEKKNGLVLTSKVLDKDMKPMKKFWEYIKPNSPLRLLTTEEIASKFRGIKDAKGLEKYLNYVKDNGGDVKKLLQIQTKNNTKLADLTKGLLEGDDIIKNVVTSDKAQEIADTLRNLDTNPIFKKAKTINTGLKTLGLGVVVLILGIGLPKFNEFLTKKLDKDIDVRPEYKRENVFIKSSLQQNADVFQNVAGGIK